MILYAGDWLTELKYKWAHELEDVYGWSVKGYHDIPAKKGNYMPYARRGGYPYIQCMGPNDVGVLIEGGVRDWHKFLTQLIAEEYLALHATFLEGTKPLGVYQLELIVQQRGWTSCSSDISVQYDAVITKPASKETDFERAVHDVQLATFNDLLPLILNWYHDKCASFYQEMKAVYGQN